MDPVDLERLIDDALKRLPEPRAPRTLLTRVMAAVDARTAPWYARPWTMWPRVWQTASTAALVVLVTGLARLWMMTEVTRDLALGRLAPVVPASVADVASSIAVAFEALRISWRVIAEPVLIPLTLFLCVMAAASMVFGVALNRVALGGASES